MTAMLKEVEFFIRRTTTLFDLDNAFTIWVK